jgi:hypothetical protein
VASRMEVTLPYCDGLDEHPGSAIILAGSPRQGRFRAGHLLDWKYFRRTLRRRSRPDCSLFMLTDPTRVVAVLPAMRPAPHGGDMSKRFAALLVALAVSGCATAPPPPTSVSKTLVPSCDGTTKECDRKNAPTPQVTKCNGFLDLRVLYGTCSQ